MEASASKGNNPERWSALLEYLSEKLQMGLLDKLKKVRSYHFEVNILFIEPANAEDERYLKKDTVLQQFRLLAQDAIEVDDVTIRSPGIDL